MKTNTNRRLPAVAGRFYPADAMQLQSTMARLFEQISTPKNSSDLTPAIQPKALIAPHAGYHYSGVTAAFAYQQLLGSADSIETVVLLGPAHHVYFEGIALPSVSAFSTPLGNIPLATDSLARLNELPAVVISDYAHQEEHSLEVQLPFLQKVLPDFELLPLLVGHCPADIVSTVIDRLWGGPETLFIISSDLSHFQDYASASKHDRDSCRRILAGDHTLKGTDACGAGPINGFLRSACGGQLQRELLHYCNSGDSSGDKQRVVGYASFSLY